MGRQFRRRRGPLVVTENSERRVGEPDRVVRLHHDVVRRVERLALVFVGQHRDRAVDLGARHTPRVVLAGDEPALAVAGVAVRVVGRLAIDRRAAGLLIPAQDAVVRDVAPQQAAPVAHPHRAFAPARASIELFDARESEAIFGEAWIEMLDVRVRIARVRHPLCECLRRDCSKRGGRARGLEHFSTRLKHDVSPCLPPLH